MLPVSIFAVLKNFCSFGSDFLFAECLASSRTRACKKIARMRIWMSFIILRSWQVKRKMQLPSSSMRLLFVTFRIDDFECIFICCECCQKIYLLLLSQAWRFTGTTANIRIIQPMKLNLAMRVGCCFNHSKSFFLLRMLKFENPNRSLILEINASFGTELLEGERQPFIIVLIVWKNERCEIPVDKLHEPDVWKRL